MLVVVVGWIGPSLGKLGVEKESVGLLVVGGVELTGEMNGGVELVGEVGLVGVDVEVAGDWLGGEKAVLSLVDTWSGTSALIWKLTGGKSSSSELSDSSLDLSGFLVWDLVCLLSGTVMGGGEAGGVRWCCGGVRAGVGALG